MPWLWHNTASLSPSPRDLAEWMTLAPSARTTAIPLFGSLALRCAIGATAGLLAISAPQYTRRVRTALWTMSFVLLVALLPPLEVFTSARSDVNYQQQLWVSLVTGALVGTAYLGQKTIQNRQQLVTGIVFLVSLTAVILGGAGLTQGLLFFERTEIEASIGIGAILFELTTLIVACVSLYGLAMRKTKPE